MSRNSNRAIRIPEPNPGGGAAFSKLDFEAALRKVSRKAEPKKD